MGETRDSTVTGDAVRQQLENQRTSKQRPFPLADITIHET
jgi:hypothetical protein